MGAIKRLAIKISFAPRKIGYDWGPRLMSWMRKRWVLFRHPHATIVFEGPVHLGRGFSLHIPEAGTFRVGPGVEFRRGFRAELLPHAVVTIGGGSVLSYHSVIQCGSSIEIGERCMFGQSTMLVDGNHRFRDLTKPMNDQGFEHTPIRIEDDATIMTKCTIIANVGTRAVVGANSLVLKPVPAYTVVGGVPAKPLEYFGPPGQEPPELAALGASDGESL